MPETNPNYGGPFQPGESLGAGSAGDFTFNVETGEILRRFPMDGGDAYADHVKVDIADLKTAYPDLAEGQFFDVLELSAWTDAGEYITHCRDRHDDMEAG